MDHREKPGTPGDILKHHGVKGMRWGVRKEEDTGGDQQGRKKTVAALDTAAHNELTKAYMAEAKEIRQPPRNLKEAQANWATNQEKFLRKFDADGPVKEESGKVGEVKRAKEPRLTPGQKKALVYAGGTVALIGGAYVLKRAGLKAFDASIAKESSQFAGKTIEPTKFRTLVLKSQARTWLGSNGYMTEKAFARPEFELPAGHTFHRISTRAETAFGKSVTGGVKGTYCTHSVDDFNRYVTGFRHELMTDKLHKVTWTTSTPTKVPNLTTVLEEMRGVLESEGRPSSRKAAMREYHTISGRGWSGGSAESLMLRLKNKGYGALVDEMDAGVIGETPLVFFGQEAASTKTSVPLDKQAIKAAETMLKEINMPPGRKP